MPLLAAAACRSDAERWLEVRDVRIELGEGVDLPIAPHGGATVGKSIYAAGTVANRHPKLAAINVVLEVKLFRHAGDHKPARQYERHGIRGLDRIAPGASAAFTEYLKVSLGGYERCEVRAVGADFVEL